MDKKLSVLVIEDNPMDQMAFERHLSKKSDFTYELYSSVSEAIKILQEKKFDVIISDYDLGDGNAFDILKFLNKNSDEIENSVTKPLNILDQPFIIVTGAGDEEIAVKAMKQGASDYLIKDLEHNFLTFLDITVKKSYKRIQIEKEIREKNQILNAILLNIPILVFKLNEKMEFTEIIGSGLLKFKLFDNDTTLIHKPLKSIFKNLPPSVIKSVSLTLNTRGHSTNFVAEIIENNQTGIFEIYLFSDNENISGAIGFGIDITEKKQAEDKLNQVYLGVQDMFFQLNNQLKDNSKKP